MHLTQINQDRWQTKIGGGCASLFGLPFFLAGLGVVVATFIPAETRGGDEIPWYFGIPFGGVFMLVGGAILFGRLHIDIDRAARTVQKRWSVLSATVYAKERSLSEFNRVRVTSKIRRTKNSSYTVYPVILDGDSGDSFDLSEDREKNKSRTQAEEIAKFLDFPIHDESSGKTHIRQPDALDMSVKDKFKSGLERNEIPDPPAELKTRVDYDGSSLRLEIPPPGFNAGFAVAFAVIAAFEIFFLTVFAFPMLSDFDSEHESRVFVVLFIVLFSSVPTLVLLALVGNTFLARQTVSVSSESVSVTRGWPFRKTTTIPSNEIEEFFVGKSDGGQTSRKPVRIGSSQEVRVIADHAQTGFGNGLKRDELKYLHALAKGILVS